MRHVLLGALLMLAACGEDTLTGRFVDAPVSGLHYVTPSRSGETRADGAFDYEDGETITFSVGATTLGSTRAAAVITPFSLFGESPEHASFIDLYRKADYGSDSVTAFDRAVNVARFLQALDADADPDNGIDLSGKADRLTGLNLSFDTPFLRFNGNFTFLANHFGVTNAQVPLETVLHNLYAGADIPTSGQQISSIVDLTDDQVSATRAFTYDDRGRTTRVDHSTGARDAYTYDAGGRILTTEEYNAAGVLEYSRAITYAADGAPTGTFMSTSNRTATLTYDEQRRLVQTSVDTNGTPRVTTTSYEGLTAIDRRVEDGVAAADISYTYDSHFNLVREAEGAYLATFTYTYDADGLAIEQTSEYRDNGQVIQTDTTVRTFDERGNCLSSTWTSGDASARAERTYDERNRVTSLRITENAQRSEWTYTFDDEQLTLLVVRFFNNDTLSEVFTVTHSYDDAGNLTREHYAIDTGGDGTTDRTQTRAYEFSDAPATVSGFMRFVLDNNRPRP